MAPTSKKCWPHKKKRRKKMVKNHATSQKKKISKLFFSFLFGKKITQPLSKKNHASSQKLYRTYYPHRSRDSVSPVCGIFVSYLKVSVKNIIIIANSCLKFLYGGGVQQTTVKSLRSHFLSPG